MGLKSKLSVQLEVKTEHDVFLDVFWKTPNQCSTMSPVQVQGAELLEGDHFGAVGSKVCWKYTLDGKEKISKQIIEAIDEEKKILTLKEFEGDILNEYENVKYILHVDAEGEKHLACWTIEYERPKENTPELTSLLQFLIDMIKAIDDHHVKQN